MNISKSEIEKEINERGDFLNIDYLIDLTKKELPYDVKKFVHIRLAEVYERLKMCNKAAQVYDSLAMISLAFAEKIKYYIKETETYIMIDEFDEADRAMKKAIREANAVEKDEVYYHIRDFYKKTAENYEKQMKINHASRVYEKLLGMRINEQEKSQMKKKLIGFYERLGKFKEARRLQEVG